MLEDKGVAVRLAGCRLFAFPIDCRSIDLGGRKMKRGTVNFQRCQTDDGGSTSKGEGGHL